MDGSAKSTRVFIFGDEYSIKGNVDAETTKKVADFVDKKMMEFQKNMASRDKLKAAVLSALNIAGELFESKENCDKLAKQLEQFEQKTGLLGKKIDAYLE
jgi:cell division protein ZapA